MSKTLVVDEVVEDDLIPHHHHDSPCECGHRHAEHSMFGSCHGCNDCSEDDDLEAEHEHPYQRCTCTDFRLATDADFVAADLAMTG